MMKLILPILLSIIIQCSWCATISSQNWNCGNAHTVLSDEVYQNYPNTLEKDISRSPYSTSWLPVSFHIVKNSSGNGGLPSNQLDDVIDILNDYYYAADIQFEQCGNAHIIENSGLYNFNVNDISYLNNNYNIPNTINVYFVNDLYTPGSGNISGIATFPWDNNELIVITNDNATNPVIAHEAGHFLGLLHTHETANGYEFVNGSNCSSAGDLICDTPADPNLSGNTVNCQYVGNYTDAYGWYYQPDIGNIMSYNEPWCLDHFSNQQVSRMHYYLNNTYSDFQCNTSGGGGEITLYAPISVNPTPVDCDGPISIHTNFINTGNSTFYGEFAAVLFDANGDYTEVELIDTGNDGLPAGYVYTNGLEFNASNLGLDPGVYSLGIFYIPAGESPIEAAAGEYQNFISVQVSCGSGGEDPAQICLSSHIQATPNPLVSGASASISYQVVNIGDEPFNGTFSADFHDMNGDWLNYVEEKYNISVCGGCTKNLSFQTDEVDLNPGSYQIVAWLQANNGDWEIMDACNYNNPVSITISGTGTTSINEQEEDRKLGCYPNPTNTIIHLDLPILNTQEANLQIMNSSGQLVYNKQNIKLSDENSTEKVVVEDWPSGFYFYRIQIEDQFFSGRFSVVK